MYLLALLKPSGHLNLTQKSLFSLSACPIIGADSQTPYLTDNLTLSELSNYLTPYSVSVRSNKEAEDVRERQRAVRAAVD